MPPKGSRKPKAATTKVAPEKEAKPAAKAPVSRKRKPVDEDLAAVEHATHAKVAADLFVVGDGDCGQFGLGEDVVEAPRPLPTSAGEQQTLQIAAGGMHSVALTASHEVWSCGVNDEGALGRHTAGELWKDKEGTASDSYTWGRVDVPTPHGHVVQISAGDSHTIALTQRGAVYGWGTYRDATGVYGFAEGHKYALLPTLVWEPQKATDQAVKIASGTDHCLMLTRGGQVMSWGTGRQGQLGRIGERLLERDAKEVLLHPHPVKRTKRHRGVSTHSPLVDVACGSYASYAIDESGHVWSWGLNQYGQLGTSDLEPALTPDLVSSLHGKDISQARGGQHHTLCLTQDNKLLSFGRPTYGRLGRKNVNINSDDAVPEAMLVDGLHGVPVSGMAAGIMVSGCYTKTGDAYLWGANTNSQLGKGDDDSDEVVPLKLKETKRFKDRKVVGLEIGGQMAFILAVPKQTTAAPQQTTAAHKQPTAAPQQTTAADKQTTTAAQPAAVAAANRSHSPPEPAPAEASS